MNFLEQWQSLSSRIRGHLIATETYFRGISQFGDGNNTAEYLLNRQKELVDNLLTFKKQHEDRLPPLVISNMGHFQTKYALMMRGNIGVNGVITSTTMIATLDAEISYLLSASEEKGISHIERAFIHLQRSIVANPNEKQNWQNAYNTSEPACERLGAVHLLGFGIWAFKANAEGERTDLILSNRSPDSDALTSRSFLVLTEWKRHRTGNALNLARDAKNQAKRYTQGSLAGFEVHSIRYIVIVSDDFIENLTDYIEDEIKYRVINIATNPSFPSA